jgi:hypothetical protein
MPVLTNPRHEAFAQALFAALSNADRDTYSHGRAYKAAGYLPSNQNSADAAASRLLRKVKPITDISKPKRTSASNPDSTYRASALVVIWIKLPGSRTSRKMQLPWCQVPLA